MYVEFIDQIELNPLPFDFEHAKKNASHWKMYYFDRLNLKFKQMHVRLTFI